MLKRCCHPPREKMKGILKKLRQKIFLSVWIFYMCFVVAFLFLLFRAKREFFFDLSNKISQSSGIRQLTEPDFFEMTVPIYFFLNTKPASALCDTFIVSPSKKLPISNSCESGFVRYFCIVLFNGLAPNVTS